MSSNVILKGSAAVAASFGTQLATARTMIASGNTAALSAAVYTGCLFYEAAFGPVKTPVKTVAAVLRGDAKRDKSHNAEFMERTITVAVAFARYLSRNPNAAIVQANSTEAGYSAAMDFLASNGVQGRRSLIQFLKDAAPATAAGSSAKPEKTLAERIAARVQKANDDHAMDAAQADALGRAVAKSLSLSDLRAFAAAVAETATELFAAEGQAAAALALESEAKAA